MDDFAGIEISPNRIKSALADIYLTTIQGKILTLLALAGSKGASKAEIIKAVDKPYNPAVLSSVQTNISYIRRKLQSLGLNKRCIYYHTDDNCYKIDESIKFKMR